MTGILQKLWGLSQLWRVAPRAQNAVAQWAFVRRGYGVCIGRHDLYDAARVIITGRAP